MAIENKRMIQKRNTNVSFIPSLGPDSDTPGAHTAGGWTSSNIYQAELVADLYDDKFYVGGSSSVYRMAMLDSGDNLILDVSSVVGNTYNLVAGYNNTCSNTSNSMTGDNNYNDGAYNLLGGKGNISNNSSYNVFVGESIYLSNSNRNMIGGYSSSASSVTYSVMCGTGHNVDILNASALFGWGNTIRGVYGSVVGGQSNTLDGTYYSAIFGYNNDTDTTEQSLQVGKQTTIKDSDYNFITGFYNYVEDADYSNIIGGQQNIISGYTNTTLISMTGLTATESNSVFVPNIILSSTDDTSTTEGTIIYDGTEFKGYTGSGWGSLGASSSGVINLLQLSDGTGGFSSDSSLKYETSTFYATGIATNQIQSASSGNEFILLTSGVIDMYGSNPATSTLKINSSGVIINDDSSSSYDFRVETDTIINALFIDAGEETINMNVPVLEIDDAGLDGLGYKKSFTTTIGIGPDGDGTGTLYTILTLPIPTDSNFQIRSTWTYINTHAGTYPVGSALFDEQIRYVKNNSGTASTDGGTNIASGGPYGGGDPQISYSGGNMIFKFNQTGNNITDYGTCVLHIEMNGLER